MDEPTQEMMRGLRLLIADDNAVNRTLLTAMLANLGAECDAVADGEDAITGVLDRSYDCIILDLHMPQVDGYTAARAIGQLNGAPPLIAFSADRDADTRRTVLDAGFVGLLTKPLSESRLTGIIADALNGTRRQDATPNEATPATDLIHDTTRAIEAAGGNRVLAAELFSMLRSDLRGKKTLLDTLEGPREQQLELVHQIHGAASHCRAEALRLAAAALEAELRREGDAEERKPVLAMRHRQLLEQIDCLLALPDPFDTSAEKDD